MTVMTSVTVQSSLLLIYFSKLVVTAVCKYSTTYIFSRLPSSMEGSQCWIPTNDQQIDVNHFVT